MARILDKNTRLIDVDFGPIQTLTIRNDGTSFPDGAGDGATFGGKGADQLIYTQATGLQAGSFIQFQRIDLDYMTRNNEVMQPVELSVQRTSSVPLGDHENGNNFDVIQEYIFILTRPLNQEQIDAVANPFLGFSEMGLNRGSTSFGGVDAGGVTHDQNLYAEKRLYTFSDVNAATTTNGGLVPGNPSLESIYATPVLADVITWGSMSAITGPTLYCYRVVETHAQGFPADGTVFTNVNLGGSSVANYPPVNVAFLCKDPNLSEGQYLTTLVNAMNSIPEGGPTA